ncbi:MAG: hypothetical protein CXZ00_15660 [Acidobacteria bacterium]|nr:MAG: hypothetical protein CXZ00_15660 [Acidobacteriota bacterium]
MVINGTPEAAQVLAYWRSLGSPIIDREADGYQKQWLPFTLPFDTDRWDKGATPNFQLWRVAVLLLRRFRTTPSPPSAPMTLLSSKTWNSQYARPNKTR